MKIQIKTWTDKYDDIELDNEGLDLDYIHIKIGTGTASVKVKELISALIAYDSLITRNEN